VQGFAGLTVREGELHLNPCLPAEWHSITVPFCWQGEPVTLTITRQAVTFSARITLWIGAQNVTVEPGQILPLAAFIGSVTGSGTTQEANV